MYISIISVLVLLLAILYLSWIRAKCAGLLITFVVAAYIVRNMPVEKMPKLVVKKSLDHINTLSILARPLAIWYIKHYGERRATEIVAFLVQSIKSDKNIQLVGK